MSHSPDPGTALIRKLLMDRSVPPKEECLAGELSNAEDFEKLYDDIFAIRETLRLFAKGDFDVPVTGRGAVWGHLKALQANLQHLAWQVEQVAAGDLTQRVDFMGDFSVAFNKMVLQLEDSLEEMKNREAAARTQIMLDATPLCSMFWNEQREAIDCNLEAVRLFGFSDKQEYLERFHELSPEYQPDGQLSAKVIEDRVNEAFEHGYVQQEFLHQKADGELVPSEVTLVRVQQEERYIIAAYIRDLRKLKKQQAALDQQRLLLLDVFNSSPICFAILVDDRIKFASTFIERFLGLSIEDPFIDCFVDREQGNALISKVKHDVPVNWEPVTIRSKEGDVKEMLANLLLTNYYGAQGVIVWLVDITELKKIESQLRAAKETAEHLGRVKDEFIANMSHELRTPMNAVMGILHLLYQTNLSEEQSSYIGTMQTSAKHLRQIINDILDFSEFESGKIFIESEEFDVRQTVLNVRSLIRKSVEEKNLTLTDNVSDDVPTLVIGDSSRVQQIFVSLADNAVKFTEQGSVHLQVQLESSEEETVMLRFSVQDTGMGMTAEDQERLFQAFAQADSSGTRSHGGIGLGLNIAKNLVELMGGTIWCESEVQKGSTFFFTATLKLPQQEDGPVVFPDSWQNMPILLVEDNKINQIVATKMLQEKGFSVDVAPHGLRAIEMLKEKEYALVLMDIQMPEMDGIQAVQEIRSDSRYDSLSIVAVTANAMEDDRRLYYEVGMNDVVAKPIEPELLYRAIRKWAQEPVDKS